MNLNDAQRMVLNAGLHEGPGIWELVPPEALDDPWRGVAFTIRACHERGETGLAAVLSEGLTRGLDVAPARWVMGPVTAEQAHQAYAEAYSAERIVEYVTRARQHLDSGVDPWRVVDDLESNLHGLDRPVREEPIPWWTWDEVLSMREEEQPWVLPGLLGVGERLVITGAEGYGKSTLIYQTVIGAAYGMSPLALSEGHSEPKRVMVLDVENWHETQVSAQFRTMRAAYSQVAKDVEPEMVLLKPRTIDLLQPTQRRLLLDAVDRFQPDLLFMGSGYKLADANDDWRVMATAIQRTADEARARSGCAVVIETHAGHGFKGDRNGWRPDGSSYWLRWPEFGIGLAPRTDVTTHRVVELVKWRGDRVTGRSWPAAFVGGGSLPWTGIDAGEYEARFPKAKGGA